MLGHVHLEESLGHRSIDRCHSKQEYAIEASYVTEEPKHGVDLSLLDVLVFVDQDVYGEE